MDIDDDFGAQDLFEDEAEVDGQDREDGEEEDESNVIPEAIEVNTGEAKPEDGDKEKEQPKKRIIRNPQPKLDPDRICGARGIATLSEVFQDFKPRGGEHAFDDLDKAMKKMEHWAHRLYPKLPFDDVMARISVLGKKMTVHTNVKKIRLGMVTVPRTPEEEGAEDEGQDETKRYDNDIPDEDAFEELVRQADQMIQVTERQSQAPKPILTDEQKERMLKNRQLAEQRRLAKQKEREQTAAKAKEDKENTMDESNKADDAFGDDDDFLVIDSKAGEPDPEHVLDDEALMKALEDDGGGIMETEQPLSQKL